MSQVGKYAWVAVQQGFAFEQDQQSWENSEQRAKNAKLRSKVSEAKAQARYEKRKAEAEAKAAARAAAAQAQAAAREEARRQKAIQNEVDYIRGFQDARYDLDNHKFKSTIDKQNYAFQQLTEITKGLQSGQITPKRAGAMSRLYMRAITSKQTEKTQKIEAYNTELNALKQGLQAAYGTGEL